MGGSPPVRIGSWPAFRACAAAGVAVGALVAAAVLAGGGRPLWPLAVLLAAGLGAFLVLALGYKVLTGHERLTSLHHQVVVLGAMAGAVALSRAPLLPTLDAAAAGLAATLAAGRLGCTLAGCCHGRPARRGLRYGAAHVEHGFPPHLAGVPLVPVQAIEGAGLAAIAAGVAIVAVSGAEPGTALAAYVCAYAALRFGTELLRGDEGRRVLAGVSEAQWTSLLLAAAVAVVAGETWQAAVAAVLAAATLWLVARRRRSRLTAPGHVRELVELAGDPLPRATSLGVRLSTGAAHYTLSGIGPGDARPVAEALVRVRHPGVPARVMDGRTGATHVVVGSPHQVEVDPDRVEGGGRTAGGGAVRVEPQAHARLDDHAGS